MHVFTDNMVQNRQHSNHIELLNLLSILLVHTLYFWFVVWFYSKLKKRNFKFNVEGLRSQDLSYTNKSR